MLKKINTKKGYNIVTIIVILIVSIFMFYWISQKEGFHEDEIFSYGSSNYKWDNLYQASGKSDFINRAIEKYIISDNLGKTIENIQYYLAHPDEFSEKEDEIHKADKPVWKTSQDAKEYLTIVEGDILNFISVYYNQVRDVHPPLFYILVHIVSCIAYGIFSKYIIFAINFVFLIMTLLVIRRIFILFNKKWLGIIAILFYGLSMGVASTVVFLRMYTMLAFFCIEYLYLNMKILKSNLEISKEDKWKLFACVLLGSLTQYYFCIFAVIVFILIVGRMIYKKQYNNLKRYILIHIVSAIIGIILFPASINHIFFSYRGASGIESGKTINDSILFYLNRLAYGFSINNILMFILITGCIIGIIRAIIKKFISKNNKKISKFYYYALIIIPAFIYFIIVSEIAPKMEAKYAIRYIMPILPEVAIIFVLAVYRIINNKKTAYILTSLVVLIISINGLVTNKPSYLYKGYNNYLELANKYKDLDFVYLVDNGFTHISSLPEFAIYNKSLIINVNYDKLDILKTDQELKNQDKFILSIKKWMDEEEYLKQVLENTGFKNYEILLDQEDDTESIIYLVSK